MRGVGYNNIVVNFKTMKKGTKSISINIVGFLVASMVGLSSVTFQGSNIPSVLSILIMIITILYAGYYAVLGVKENEQRALCVASLIFSLYIVFSMISNFSYTFSAYQNAKA